jgi:predicted AlkP superfamily pyrophosphatase or phosphodiesterase
VETGCSPWSATQVRNELLRHERHRWALSRILFYMLNMLKRILTLCAVAAVVHAQHTPVLLVSVDGLRPDYLLQADRYGLKIPHLRRMLAEGAHATGVHGVLPTVTYPSHATLVTGVSPARHGICANTTFDPEGRNYEGWYWYAADLQVPTLWDEARNAGLTTANMQWPVTAGAAIDFNVPQYWRAGTADDHKLLRLLSTPGLLELLEHDTESLTDGADESIDGDQRRAKAAVRLLELKRPGFMTVYLASLDNVEHEHGPFSAEANATLEQIDALIGRLRTAAGALTVVSVVSDHGFLKVDKEVHLLTAFRQHGLLDADEAGHVKSWQATAWFSGATAAIRINPQAPSGTQERVGGLLEELVKDANSGLARVLSGDEVKRLGGCQAAAFLVELKPGFMFGSETGGPLVTNSKLRGMHGYLADRNEMNSTFLIAGPGVPAGQTLGEIDMRDIAPTLAGILGIRLSEAEGHDVLAREDHPGSAR